jgi:hypothetical protein
MYAIFAFFTCCTDHRVSSAKIQNSKPSVQHVHCSFTLHRSSSSECRGPRPEARDPKICTQYVHLSLIAQITECWVPKLKTQNPVCNMLIFIYITQNIEFRVLRAETQSPRPKNMYATCPFFTCCTNHWVSCAETRNSKPGMQHVHFSFTLHRSSSSECWVLKHEARDPKICMQHVHFSLVAQITEVWVPKPETRNPVCNMSIFHLYYTNYWVPSAKGWDPKPETQKYVCNISIFHLLHKSPSFKCWNPKLKFGCATCSLFIYITQIIEFQVPRAEARNPKSCTQHVHFSLIAQITKCRVLKLETWYFKWTQIVFVCIIHWCRVQITWELYLSVLGTWYSVISGQWSVVSTRDLVVNIGKW